MNRFRWLRRALDRITCNLNSWPPLCLPSNVLTGLFGIMLSEIHGSALGVNCVATKSLLKCREENPRNLRDLEVSVFASPDQLETINGELE